MMCFGRLKSHCWARGLCLKDCSTAHVMRGGMATRSSSGTEGGMGAYLGRAAACWGQCGRSRW